MTNVNISPTPGAGERLNEMHKLMTDTNAGHFAFWETAGWIAVAVIVAIFAAGVLMAATQIGRARHGRR